jgi:hypothetical protein
MYSGHGYREPYDLEREYHRAFGARADDNLIHLLNAISLMPQQI